MPPFLHELKLALKLLKPLFYLLCVWVCVCTLEEGMGEQYSFNFPLFLPFLFPAFSSELRSYLLSCFVGLN